MNQSEVTAELIEKFRAYDSFRQQFDESAIECYKLFVGSKDEEREGANLHIPKTYEIVDTIRARLVKSFFGQRPYIDFIPQPQLGNNPQGLSINEEKAEVAAALVDSQLDKNDIVQKMYNFFTSLLVFPAAILHVGWKYEEEYVKRRVPKPQYVRSPLGPQFAGWDYQIEEGMETTFDDNYISYVDYFDFWPDPDATNIDDARGVFHREYMTKEELMQQLEFLHRLDQGTVFPVDIDELAAQRPKEGRWERLSEIGVSSQPIDSFMDHDSDKSNLEVLHYWEDNRHAILVNREQVVYDGPNPYWRHRKKPYVFASYDPRPGELYGFSAVEIIEDLQHELNTQHNQRIDNISFVLNKMWKVRRSADINESQLVSRPNGIVEVDNMEDVQPFEMNDITSSSFREESITGKNMQNATGTPAIIRGASGGDDQTATEVTKKSNNAGLRFDTKIMYFESAGIQRLAELMDMNNQQFISDSRVIKLGPQESTQWREIEPNVIIGEHDYRPAGSNQDPAANKQVRREQLTQMMKFLLESGIPYVDMYAMTKEWLSSFDLKNTDKFLIPRQVVQQQQAAKQAAMQQQQAQQQKGKRSGKQGAAGQSQVQRQKPPLQGGQGGRM